MHIYSNVTTIIGKGWSITDPPVEDGSLVCKTAVRTTYNLIGKVINIIHIPVEQKCG